MSRGPFFDLNNLLKGWILKLLYLWPKDLWRSIPGFQSVNSLDDVVSHHLLSHLPDKFRFLSWDSFDISYIRRQRALGEFFHMFFRNSLSNMTSTNSRRQIWRLFIRYSAKLGLRLLVVLGLSLPFKLIWFYWYTWSMYNGHNEQ